MARIDYNRAGLTYDQGRALPLETFGEWRTSLAEFLPTTVAGPILDVGSGTGIWLEAFVEWFGLPMVGIEPSPGMRSVAQRKALPTGALIVAGDAQAIPLRDGSCRAAWISTVIHHIPDLPTCVAELRRVLRPGGVVLIRSSFPGRQDEIPHFRYIPGAMKIASTFPTVDQTVDVFEEAGFQREALRRIHEERDPSFAILAKRVRAMRHADSTLASLTDEEFDDGMAALETAAAAGSGVPPMGLDLLVLR